MGDIQAQGAMDAMKKNMSAFNPVDMAAMKSPNHPGYIDPQKTTVRQYFEQNGVDVDGPVVQLVKFAQDQAKKASPISKMQGIAGGGMPVPPGGPQAPAQAPQPEGGGLEGLMKGLGG